METCEYTYGYIRFPFFLLKLGHIVLTTLQLAFKNLTVPSLLRKGNRSGEQLWVGTAPGPEALLWEAGSHPHEDPCLTRGGPNPLLDDCNKKTWDISQVGVPIPLAH